MECKVRSVTRKLSAYCVFAHFIENYDYEILGSDTLWFSNLEIMEQFDLNEYEEANWVCLYNIDPPFNIYKIFKEQYETSE